jgi:Fic family protein
MSGCFAQRSPDTALRDINELLGRGVLWKSDAGGRSTGYELIGSS